MNVFGWINLAFGILGASSGVIVLRGVFHTKLSSASARRFLSLSLVASVAGLMPLTPHLTPVQEACILSVYCSGAAIICWRRFALLGRSRGIFAIAATAVLYFDLVSVFTRIFPDPSLMTAPVAQLLFQFVQILLALAFIGIGVLAAKRCRIGPTIRPALGKFSF